jgi:uncharacterized protein (UPF0332 family)/predicted nucleotidyltransferase
MTSAPPIHPAIAGDAAWQRAVCAFVERVRAHYGDRLAAVVLYGSRARGDADEEGSDVDLLVVLRDDFDSSTEYDTVARLRYDLEERFGYPLLSPLVATEADYRERMLPLFMNVRREGIELWPLGGPKRVAEEKGEYQGEGNDDLQLVLLRAHEALDDSQLGLGESRHGWAANRAYYAMFHAATALLLSEGLAFSRHRGVIGAFHERYIKTGKLPRALGTHLDDAFVARNKADYAYREEVGAGEASRLVEQATEFIAAAEQLIGIAGEPS